MDIGLLYCGEELVICGKDFSYKIPKVPEIFLKDVLCCIFSPSLWIWNQSYGINFFPIVCVSVM